MDTALIFAIVTAVGIFVFAMLYSNAGQGGSAGYLAIMLLFGMPMILMRPTVLLLNAVVALVASIRAYRSGLFRWRIFWPFALGSIPAALLAANYKVRPVTYFAVVAFVLLYAAVRLFFGIGTLNEKKTTIVPIWLALLAGVAIGALAGLAGVGGGIFVTTILLLMRWAKTNEAIGVAAPFVFLNSVIVFAFSQPAMPFLVSNIVYWVPAAFVGAWVGSEADMRVIPVAQISKALALLVLAAALKSLTIAF